MKENDKNYLTAKEIKILLKSAMGELSHYAIIRLLLNGISLSEIKKLRLKDIKFQSYQLVLKNPKRKVTIHPATNKSLIDWINHRMNTFRSDKDKIFNINDRTVRNFIKDYGNVEGINTKCVTQTTLINTFYLITLVLKPEWTVVDFNNHLGNKSLDYTQEKIEYFKGEIAKYNNA